MSEFVKSCGIWFRVLSDGQRVDYGNGDHYSFENGNWWNNSDVYRDVNKGSNMTRYKVGSKEKEIELTHGLFSSREIDAYQRDAFLEAAEGLPVYLFIHKNEIRMTTDRSTDFPEPCGVVDRQTSMLIVCKACVGFVDDQGLIVARECYKNFFPQELISRTY